MKTRFWKTLGKSIPLFILILCLVVIWNISIYKAWYSLIPWNDLGSLPAKAGAILRIDFPNNPSIESRPTIYVYAWDGKTYPCCSLSPENSWLPGEYSYYAISDYRKQEKHACANIIKQEWELEEEDFQNAQSVVVQGICSPYGPYQYAIYQIRQDGSVWEKYVNSERIDGFREGFTFYGCLAVILYILALTGFFKKIAPLELKQYYDIKSFFRENKGKLFLLLAPVLCLIVLWNVNIYKIWHDNTPWRNLGAPPSSKVVRILDISFPNSPFLDSRTLLYVYTFDKSIYLLDGKSQWRLGHNMSFYANPDFNKEEKDEKLACAVKIKQEWGFEEQGFQSEESIVAQGICSPDDSYQYAIYRITPDGSIWEKYVNGAMLDHFRESVSFWIKFATILYILVWTGVFKKDNPFKTKPDLDAN